MLTAMCLWILSGSMTVRMLIRAMDDQNTCWSQSPTDLIQICRTVLSRRRGSLGSLCETYRSFSGLTCLVLVNSWLGFNAGYVLSGLMTATWEVGIDSTKIQALLSNLGRKFNFPLEYLDQTSWMELYQCAPSEIWSFGCVLTDLTCGPNPWKRASVKHSTYKAFTKSSNFLKSILPLSDGLNGALG
jgi:hypothetical protein